jgi:hypothetical protein
MKNLFSKTVGDGFKRIKNAFTASNLEVSTTWSDGDLNPAVESAYTANYTPKVGKIDSYDYIKYGSDDKLDLVYDALLYQSATHSGILSKKAKMVAGNELVIENEESLGDETSTEFLEWSAFKQRAGGTGRTLYDVIKRAAYFYEKDGGVGLDVTYDAGFNSIISIKVISQQNLRCGLPDNKTNEVNYYVTRTCGFKRGTSKAIPIKEEKIDAFDPLNESSVRQFYYIKNPMSSSEYYGTPNYLGAYYFIAADFEFGKTIFNSARNGFSPKFIATIVGRNMSVDEKRAEAEKFKNNFQGSSGEQVMISWIKKKDDAPDFHMIETQNLDKMIDVMAQLNDAKILTAHNVTSPTLFGIMVAGKLGGTGNELQTAYELFRVTETLPTRELIISAFQSIIDKCPKYKELEMKLTIKDVEIDFGTKNTQAEGDSEDSESEPTKTEPKATSKSNKK